MIFKLQKTLLLGLPDYSNSNNLLDKFVEGYQFEHDGYIFITMSGADDNPAVVEIDNVLVAFNEDNESTYFFPVTKRFYSNTLSAWIRC